MGAYFKTVLLVLALITLGPEAKTQDTAKTDTLMRDSETTTQVDTSSTGEAPPINNFVEQSPAADPSVSKAPISIWILLILSLLALAGFVYLFFTKMDKKQAVIPADFYKKDFELAMQPLQATINELKTQQKTIKEQLEQLQKEKSETKVIEQTEFVEADRAINKEEPGPIRTWYSVAPKNGIFFARQLVEEFKPREHIYRIEVLDEARAYYYLVDDNATRQHAFNIPDSYILPAMELDGNGRLAEANQIDIQRGSLIRAGNNWQIEEKAILNYSV